MSAYKSDPENPAAIARAILDAHGDDPRWLERFSKAMLRRKEGLGIEQVLTIWGINQAEFAELLGISRQAVGKWLISGPPADRVGHLAELAAATEILMHYIKAERIRAVVRRNAERLQQRSLVDLLARGKPGELLTACRAMFSFERANTVSPAVSVSKQAGSFTQQA